VAVGCTADDSVSRCLSARLGSKFWKNPFPESSKTGAVIDNIFKDIALAITLSARLYRDLSAAGISVCDNIRSKMELSVMLFNNVVLCFVNHVLSALHCPNVPSGIRLR
jgi:hypothetical protein